MRQTCHAVACPKSVPPGRLMCIVHWRMVPYALQKAVWEHYKPGQEKSKDLSDEYMEAAQAAINAVAELEHRA